MSGNLPVKLSITHRLTYLTDLLMGMSIDFSVIVFKLVIITFKLSEGEIQPTYINFIRVHVKCLVSIFIWLLIQLRDRVKFF